MQLLLQTCSSALSNYGLSLKLITFVAFLFWEFDNCTSEMRQKTGIFSLHAVIKFF